MKRYMVLTFLGILLSLTAFKCECARQEARWVESVHSDPGSIFYLLSLGKYAEVLQMIKDRRFRDVNISSDKGYTPLLFIAFWSKDNPDAVELAKELIKRGAKVNALGGWGISGSTPLTLAASNGTPEMVRLLLEAGATRGVKEALKEAKDANVVAARKGVIDHDAQEKVSLLEAALSR